MFEEKTQHHTKANDKIEEVLWVHQLKSVFI